MFSGEIKRRFLGAAVGLAVAAAVAVVTVVVVHARPARPAPVLTPTSYRTVGCTDSAVTVHLREAVVVTGCPPGTVAGTSSPLPGAGPVGVLPPGLTAAQERTGQTWAFEATALGTGTLALGTRGTLTGPGVVLIDLTATAGSGPLRYNCGNSQSPIVETCIPAPYSPRSPS